MPYVCASPAYAARNGVPLSLPELAQHSCLVGNSDEWHFTLQGQPHTLRVQGQLHCNSGHALLDAALKGIGIIQLPDYYVYPHLANGELLELFPECRAPAEGIWALYPQNRHLSPKVRLLVDYLAEQLGSASPTVLTRPIP
jgi:DNA-binding transcriptional LysR family regulator